jgi:hypothetical protein
VTVRFISGWIVQVMWKVLIRDAQRTLKEFGAPGDDVPQLLEGRPSARRSTTSSA